MKKITMFTLLGILSLTQAFSQACVGDVWMTLRNKQIGKAKRMIDECYASFPDNADVLLMRGNVYLQRYDQEQEYLRKDPNYKIKDEEAIWTAYESFYKAIQINPKVEAKTGNIGTTEGQILCAGALYADAGKYIKNGDLDKAEQYLQASIRGFLLDKGNPNLSLYLGYIYLDLAMIAFEKKDTTNYKKMLIEGTKVKPNFSEPYLLLYDVYLSEKDTVSCGDILKAARANVPDSTSKNIYEYEIGYYAMIGEFDKMTVTADNLLDKFGNTPENIALVAGYLNNNYQLEKAEEYLNRGLAVAPDNFELIQQMGYRWFYAAEQIQIQKDEAILSGKYDKATELGKVETELLEKAHSWAEKAYNIKRDDKINNRMLRMLKVQLRLEIPEELEEE